jgi:hypothetical protein
MCECNLLWRYVFPQLARDPECPGTLPVAAGDDSSLLTINNIQHYHAVDYGEIAHG